MADSFPEDFALYWAFLAFGVTVNGPKVIHPGFDKQRVDGLTVGLAFTLESETPSPHLYQTRTSRQAGERCETMG